jgi:putative FmdB family regulatory protein
MPTYTFRCTECGYVEDKFLKMAERDKQNGGVCPNCEAEALDRGVNTPMIVSGVNELYSKIPHGFRDVLKKMDKDAGKHSKIVY